MKIENKYIDRFFNNIDIGKLSSCWEWKAGKDSSGYGVFNFFDGNKFKNEKSHRFMELFLFGEIERNKCVLHKCDNRSCCNPSHFWIGTRKENNFDRDIKGRHISLKGIKHGGHKLKNFQVINITVLRDCGITLKQIANLYKVSTSMIHNIVTGKNWKHLK